MNSQPSKSTLDEKHQLSAIDALRGWSKWLIGINFVAGAGCMMVLQAGVRGPPRPFLLAAIAAFAISAVCSTFLVRVLASVVERLPLHDESGNRTSIFNHKAPFGLCIKTCSHIQLTITFIGVVCLLTWVMLKPSPPSPSQETNNGRKKNTTIDREELRSEVDAILKDQAEIEPKPQNLTVTALTVTDEGGRVLAHLGGNDGTATFRLHDKNQKPYASFHTNSQGGVFNLRGNPKNGSNPTSVMYFAHGAPFINLFPNTNVDDAEPIIFGGESGIIVFKQDG